MMLSHESSALGLGQAVVWTSQAGGYYRKKSGKIVFIFGPEENLIQIAKKYFQAHVRMFDGTGIPGRAKVGYLIEVLLGPGQKPRLYLPYPGKLSLQ